MSIIGLKTSKSIRILIYSFLFIFSLSDFATAQAQKTRIIEKYTFKDEPIEIIGIESNQTQRKLDKEFVYSNEWLNDFSIEFKNTTKKPITFVEIAMDFPETKSSGSIMAFSIYYGSRKNDETVKPINHNEIAKIVINENNLTRLKKFIESRHIFEALTQVKLRVSFIKFNDNTAWSAGTFLRPSPENPNKYLPIE